MFLLLMGSDLEVIHKAKDGQVQIQQKKITFQSMGSLQNVLPQSEITASNLI